MLLKFFSLSMSSMWYDNFCFLKPKEQNESFFPLLRKVDILHETYRALNAVEWSSWNHR